MLLIGLKLGALTPLLARAQEGGARALTSLLRRANLALAEAAGATRAPWRRAVLLGLLGTLLRMLSPMGAPLGVVLDPASGGDGGGVVVLPDVDLAAALQGFETQGVPLDVDVVQALHEDEGGPEREASSEGSAAAQRLRAFAERRASAAAGQLTTTKV